MKKKRLKILVLGFLSLFLINSMISMIYAADVAYIYNKKFRIDKNIVKTFEEVGLSVELINEKQIPKDFSDYKLIFIGDERFININRIPAFEKPTILITSYNGLEWGITDQDGISLYASTSPLAVLKDNRKIIVYTQARYDNYRISIPYYYLNEGNRAKGFTPIAITDIGSMNGNLGDVISYIEPGIRLENGKSVKAKSCYFGIVESKYWTKKAKDLFKDCVNFVAESCEQDSECGENESSNKYCSNGDVYQDIEVPICLNPGLANSECSANKITEKIEECNLGCENGRCLEGKHDVRLINISSTGKIKILDENNKEILGEELLKNQKYKIIIQIENSGENTENVNFSGNIDGLEFSHLPIKNFEPGAKKIKTKTINLTLKEGLYNININALLNKDENPEDNAAIRLIKVIKQPQCIQDSDCGEVSYGENYCSNGNIVRIKNVPKCFNTICSQINETEIIEQCQNGCENASCISLEIKCNSSIDCGENKFLDNKYCLLGNVHQDFLSFECVNPGTPESYCKNDSVPILYEYCNNECVIDSCIDCYSNSDCGENGLIGTKYCIKGDVYQNYQEFECKNPEEDASKCESNAYPKLIEKCDTGCSDGKCIEENISCSEDSDCGENLCTEWSENYCKNNSIYKRRSCTQNFCQDSECRIKNNSEEQKIEECPQKCEMGKCVSSIDDLYINNARTYPKQIFEFQEFGILYNTHKIGDLEDWVPVEVLLDGIKDNHVEKNPFPKENFTWRLVDHNGLTAGMHKFEVIIDPNNEISEFNENNNHFVYFFNVIEKTECFEDKDCGEIIYSGKYCEQGKSVRKVFTPRCLNNSCKIINITEIVEDCEEMCENGECINKNIECSTNLDCGEDNWKNQDFCDKGNVYDYYVLNSCINPATKQSSCSKQTLTLVKHQCENGCSNGKCIEENINCYQDENCNDKNNNTKDLCINPGTKNSFCIYKNIICFNENDCGQDHFLNQKFCSSKGLFDYFEDYSCINPGTINAICTAEISEKLINPCQNKTCQDIGKKYCKNNNVYINQKCNEEKCTENECINKEINQSKKIEKCEFKCFEGKCINPECNKDSECGSQSQKNICKNDENLYTLRITPKCYQGVCSSEKKFELKQKCEFGCSNGKCEIPDKIIDFYHTRFYQSKIKLTQDSSWEKSEIFEDIEPKIEIYDPIKQKNVKVQSAINIENDGFMVFKNKMRDGGKVYIKTKNGEVKFIAAFNSDFYCPGGLTSSCIYSREGNLLYNYKVNNIEAEEYSKVKENKRYMGECPEKNIEQIRNSKNLFCGEEETKVELKAGDVVYFKGEDYLYETGGTGLEIWEYS